MDDYISGLKTLLYMQVIIIITITIFIIIVLWKNKLVGSRIKTLCTMDMPIAQALPPSPRKYNQHQHPSPFRELFFNIYYDFHQECSFK